METPLTNHFTSTTNKESFEGFANHALQQMVKSAQEGEADGYSLQPVGDLYLKV